MNSALDQFISTYEALHKDNLSSLRAVYSPDVVFEDSVHRAEGIDALLRYFDNQYRDLISCRFTVRESQRVGDTAWLAWDMDYAHPRLRRGTPLHVKGASHLRLREAVHYHRDYVDMGQVLYEHLPVLGSAVRWLKRRTQA